jgi:hypothetical protein
VTSRRRERWICSILIMTGRRIMTEGSGRRREKKIR